MEVWSISSLPLLPGPLWPGVVVPISVRSVGEIDLFRNYLYSVVILDVIYMQIILPKNCLYLIGPCAKTEKNLVGNNDTKDININEQLTWFSNLLAWIKPCWVDMPIRLINQSTIVPQRKRIHAALRDMSSRAIYIYIYNRLIGLVGRVFANGPGDLGSIPDRVISKTLKW